MEHNSLKYGGKLVVINDAPKFADYLRKLLVGKGYRCVFVNSVEEAKQLLQNEGYDTIVYGHEFLLTEKTRKKVMEERSVIYGGEFIVINDNPSLVNRIAKWMAEKGYRYVFVNSLDEAKQLLAQKDYDTVIYGHEFRFNEKYYRKH